MAEKFTQTLTRDDLPAFFRKLADACESTPSEGFPDCTKAKKDPALDKRRIWTAYC
ncbi:hypothetical protein [Halodesulfovibrio sp. MK-HDV]|uniref:hypothetical protein n=1 Tax=Halodesulfovibrio sp. MK-HDV TaxID=2599925 RepID=UPI00136E21B7|nr:hypothetical protein [Halodesulfovibrio sp. MK-HDV]KAF1077178.1 hypothetical protein MKHDV_00777 [Halodesulfovibrio sp. MK-HDV]